MSLPDLSSTLRTELGRHHERGRTERDDLYAVLDAGLICHLGVIVNGAPRVLPTGYGRLGDLLYLHGSSANSSIMAGNGQEICVTVTPDRTPPVYTAAGVDCGVVVAAVLVPISPWLSSPQQ